MHRSKLNQLVIDCRTDDLAGARDFWAGALGAAPASNATADRYLPLRGDGGIGILLQRCEWPSAYHLDIETDDLEAEVRRLEALGASRVRQQQNWWVMRAPTGHDFCVVQVRPEDLPADAHSWSS